MSSNTTQIRYCIKDDTTDQRPGRFAGPDGKVSLKLYDVYFVSTDPEGESTLDALMWHEDDLTRAMPEIHGRVSRRSSSSYTLAADVRSYIQTATKAVLPEDFAPGGSARRKWDFTLGAMIQRDYVYKKKTIVLEEGESCWVSAVTVDGPGMCTVHPPRPVIAGKEPVQHGLSSGSRSASAAWPAAQALAGPSDMGQRPSGSSSSHVAWPRGQPGWQDASRAQPGYDTSHVASSAEEPDTQYSQAYLDWQQWNGWSAFR